MGKLCNLARSASCATMVLASAAPSWAQTFVQCEIVSGGNHESTRTYAFSDEGKVWTLAVGNKLLPECDLSVRDRSVFPGESKSYAAQFWVDDIRCEVTSEIVRVSTTSPAIREFGGPRFVEFEIYRSTGEIRTMLGHAFAGYGKCARVEDPRKAAKAF